jgi:methylglutaconyl-CoA hydratase
MGFQHILVAKGPVSGVTLNRPDVRNAMSDLTLRELTAAFIELGRDPSVRAIVVRGEGKDFCAGADIEWMRRAGTLKAAQGKKDARLLAEMCRAVSECPCPVLVRAHGNVFGGGLGLVAACDITVAAEDAKMCFSETRLGILPAVISCFVLPKIGAAAARRYYLTAEVFGMPAAKGMGLVHEVCPEAELDARLSALTDSIQRNGPKAVREAKAIIRKMDGLSLERRVALSVDTLVRLRSSPEGQEGLSAFLEKRPASWARKP